MQWKHAQHKECGQMKTGNYRVFSSWIIYYINLRLSDDILMCYIFNGIAFHVYQPIGESWCSQPLQTDLLPNVMKYRFILQTRCICFACLYKMRNLLVGMKKESARRLWNRKYNVVGWIKKYTCSRGIKYKIYPYDYIYICITKLFVIV